MLCLSWILQYKILTKLFLAFCFGRTALRKISSCSQSVNWMNARVCNVVCCICSNRCCHSSRRNQVIQRFIRYCRPVLKFSIHRVLSCLVLWVILAQFRPNMYLRFSLTVQWRRQKLKFGGLVPQRGPGTEPLVGAMKAKPPKTGGWGGAPRSWAVFSYVGVQLLRFF